jgi:hypothetical protein
MTITAAAITAVAALMTVVRTACALATLTTERILAMPPASRSPTGRGSSPVRWPAGRKDRSASRTAVLARAGSSLSDTKTSRSPESPRRTNAFSPAGSVTWRMRIMLAFLPGQPPGLSPARRPMPGAPTSARRTARWPSTSRADSQVRRRLRPGRRRLPPCAPLNRATSARGPRQRAPAASEPEEPGRAGDRTSPQHRQKRRPLPLSPRTPQDAGEAGHAPPWPWPLRSPAAGGGAFYRARPHLRPNQAAARLDRPFPRSPRDEF